MPPTVLFYYDIYLTTALYMTNSIYV